MISFEGSWCVHAKTCKPELAWISGSKPVLITAHVWHWWRCSSRARPFPDNFFFIPSSFSLDNSSMNAKSLCYTKPNLYGFEQTLLKSPPPPQFHWDHLLEPWARYSANVFRVHIPVVPSTMGGYPALSIQVRNTRCGLHWKSLVVTDCEKLKEFRSNFLPVLRQSW